MRPSPEGGVVYETDVTKVRTETERARGYIYILRPFTDALKIIDCRLRPMPSLGLLPGFKRIQKLVYPYCNPVHPEPSQHRAPHVIRQPITTQAHSHFVPTNKLYITHAQGPSAPRPRKIPGHPPHHASNASVCARAIDTTLVKVTRNVLC